MSSYNCWSNCSLNSVCSVSSIRICKFGLLEVRRLRGRYKGGLIIDSSGVPYLSTPFSLSYSASRSG